MLLFQKIKTSRPQRLALCNAEEAARFILQMEDDSDVETAEDPNYSAIEDDGESDHAETDNESFDDTVDGTANTTVDTTVNTTANTFSIDVDLETRNCNVSENVSSGEDVDDNDSRSTFFNKFVGETPVKLANGPVYTAKSGKKLNSVPPPSFHTRGADIFSKKVGPKVTDQTQIEVFELFLSGRIYTKILQNTNKYSREQSANEGCDWKELGIGELKTFMGLLILIGVTKGNHESVPDLWSSGPLGGPIFKAAMPVNRF